MAGPTRTHLSDLRGTARMVFDATAGVAGIVEKMHRTIQVLPFPVGRAEPGATRGITGFVYRSVQGSVRLIGRGIDVGLAPIVAWLPEGESTPVRDAFVSAVNGVYGDYLVRTGNPLAIGMGLRHRDRPIDPAKPALAFTDGRDIAPGGRLLLMVHGLCLNERHWAREGHDHGAALADELGYTPLYLRYNTGRHIGLNGQELARLLETLVSNWPGSVEELVILGHSMGGLVARSACHYGREAGHGWLNHLSKLVFLGTPHHGSPLERGGHRLDYVLEVSPYSAPFTRIGKMRSAGITDLRHGSITTGTHAVVPLPSGVKCYAAAATLAARRSMLAERLVGDGLVPLDSALGRHARPGHTLAIPKERQWVGYGMGHLELLNRAEVYSKLLEWLQDRGGRARRPRDPPRWSGRPPAVTDAGRPISLP
jgi:pimeloyl-ACP methyl ester carboxylesterase